MITLSSLLGDAAASGSVMSQTRNPLEELKSAAKKDLRTLKAVCYAWDRHPGGDLSQIEVEVFENKPVLREPTPQ